MKNLFFTVFATITCFNLSFAQFDEAELEKYQNRLIVENNYENPHEVMESILSNEYTPGVVFSKKEKCEPKKRSVKKHQHGDFEEEALLCPECNFNFTEDGLDIDQMCPDCGAIPGDYI